MHPQDRLFCEIAVQLELLTRDQVTECMQALQRDPRGRNIGTVATSLNFMSQAEAELVLTHQQRVLERRREARAASKGQQEGERSALARTAPGGSNMRTGGAVAPAARQAAEQAPARRGAEAPGAERAAAPRSEPQPAARAAVPPVAPRPAAGLGVPRAGNAAAPGERAAAPSDPQRGRRSEPTPTAAWVNASPEPGLAESELARSVAPPPDDASLSLDEARETLDERPNVRSARATLIGTPDEASFESMGESLRDANHSPAASAAQPARRALPTQLEGGGNAAQAAQRPLASQLADTGNANAAPAQVSQRPAQPASRMVPSAHGTQLGPPRPMPPAQPYAASESAAPQAYAASRAASFGSGPAIGGGTLLGGAALAQRHQAEGNAAALRRSRRPVPSGRDWRNPSHPPPPTDALDADPALGRAAHADTVALPANDVSVRPRSTPELGTDTPRYLDGALHVALQSGASDLHLHSGAQLCMRVDGKLWPLTDGVVITRDVAERVIAEVLDQSQRMQLALEGELRFSYALASVGRVRAHAYSQERGTDIVFRLSPSPLGSAEKLGLSSMLRSVREQPAGLYVCSGPAGAGKTTTLAALTQALVSERARHVVSVESPIEIVHSAGLGLVEQREVGQHVGSFAQGIELAQRQGADIIVVSDLGADGALEASLRAASARCLVLGGLRASSAVQAISKLLRARDARHYEQLRFELSHALQLVTHQRLLPRAKGTGRVLALETLVNTPQVSLLFREDKLHQLPAAMSAGRSHGMLLLDDALEELVRAGTISHEVARRVARRRERFKGA